MYKKNKLCCVNNYTKVNDKLVAKYGLKAAYLYAKLCYRMNLSLKNKDKFFFDNGYFIIYKINDLAHDAHMGRNSVINNLKRLEKHGLIYRVHTLYASHIYLPKFTSGRPELKNKSHESFKSKPTRNNKNNKINNNNYVSSSKRSSVKKADQNSKKQYPNIGKIIDRFGKPLFNYALNIYHIYVGSGKRIHNSVHFIYGILRRWQRKGIKTVNDAMLSEHDCHAQPSIKGPTIPIFKI